jgi:hypothetical protein
MSADPIRSEAMFSVGQKVVCVNAHGGEGLDDWAEQERIFDGETYTVRRCFVDTKGDAIVWLDEVERTEYARKFWGDQDLGYGAHRFRPIASRKTSIEIFQRMLTPKKVNEHA